MSSAEAGTMINPDLARDRRRLQLEADVLAPLAEEVIKSEFRQPFSAARMPPT
jgi:hypothetical protein